MSESTRRNTAFDWDLPSPHLASLAVERADIDAYEHVNNAVYMAWFDRAAWDHSAALGLPIEKCLQLDRGMAVVRSVIAYLRPAVLGDTVQAATWLLPADGEAACPATLPGAARRGRHDARARRDRIRVHRALEWAPGPLAAGVSRALCRARRGAARRRDPGSGLTATRPYCDGFATGRALSFTFALTVLYTLTKRFEGVSGGKNTRGRRSAASPGRGSGRRHRRSRSTETAAGAVSPRQCRLHPRLPDHRRVPGGSGHRRLSQAGAGRAHRILDAPGCRRPTGTPLQAIFATSR